MFDAVVFDMDGVIFDSEKLYRRFEREVGKRLGASDETLSRLSDRLAGGTRESNRHVFAEIMGTKISYDEFRSEFMTKMDAYTSVHGMELKPGVKELFKFLSERGIKIALATSTYRERAEKHLKAHGLYEYFDEMVYGDMIKNGKPAPDIYLKACELLQVKPEKTIGVEDSINGVISASTAGLYTVMVVDLIQPNDEVKKRASEIYSEIISIRKLFQ